MTFHYRSMNLVNLVGRIGKEPQLKQLQNGSAFSFSLCTEISVRKDEKWTQVPTWHNCTVYGPAADRAAKILKTGDLVSLTGRIVYRDADKNGVKVRYTDILVENFTLLASKSAPKTSEAAGPEVVEEPAPADPDLF